MRNSNAAKHLMGGATDLFRSLRHEFEDEDSSSDDDDDGDDRESLHPSHDLNASEQRSVFMLSGCKDDQTSADAFIQGKHVGAMSWAFLETMRFDYGWNISYVQLLQNTRMLLRREYKQIPQLSVGFQFDLNYPLRL